MQTQDWDCLIIGGGPAGLTAAVYLARYRRNVVVFDSGESRAAPIPESHNYPGFAQGISGRKLLSLLNNQVNAYGVAMIHSRVTSLTRTEAGFVGCHDNGKVSAPFVLLATGIVDAHPTVEELDEAIGDASLRYCPVCDGYEALDRRLAVLGDGEDAFSKAIFLRTYSRDVTLLWQKEKPHARTAAAQDHGFAIEGPVDGLKPISHGMRATLGERVLDFDIVYPAMGCDVRAELASRLGAATTDVGCLKVDAHNRTTVDGLYAAGDVVSDLHQIVVAIGHAAVAATHIHKSLPRNIR